MKGNRELRREQVREPKNPNAIFINILITIMCNLIHTDVIVIAPTHCSTHTQTHTEIYRHTAHAHARSPYFDCFSSSPVVFIFYAVTCCYDDMCVRARRVYMRLHTASLHCVVCCRIVSFSVVQNYPSCSMNSNSTNDDDTNSFIQI